MHFDSLDSLPESYTRNQVEFRLLARNSSRRDKNKKQREGTGGGDGGGVEGGDTTCVS